MYKFNFMNAFLMKRLAEKKGVDSSEAMKIAIFGGYANFKEPLTFIAPIKMADEQVAIKQKGAVLESRLSFIADKIVEDDGAAIKKDIEDAVKAAKDKNELKIKIQEILKK